MSKLREKLIDKNTLFTNSRDMVVKLILEMNSGLDKKKVVRAVEAAFKEGWIMYRVDGYAKTLVLAEESAEAAFKTYMRYRMKKRNRESKPEWPGTLEDGV